MIETDILFTILRTLSRQTEDSQDWGNEFTLEGISEVIGVTK